jgi:hypothetical protein
MRYALYVCFYLFFDRQKKFIRIIFNNIEMLY